MTDGGGTHNKNDGTHADTRQRNFLNFFFQLYSHGLLYMVKLVELMLLMEVYVVFAGNLASGGDGSD